MEDGRQPRPKVSWKSVAMMKGMATRTRQRLGFKMEGRGKVAERLNTNRTASFSLKAPVSGGVTAIKGLFESKASKQRCVLPLLPVRLRQRSDLPNFSPARARRVRCVRVRTL